LWFYEYLYKQEANKWTEKRIEQLQILRKITLELINFIAQFEDELVKIWNKPKFVLNSNYVITLDRIANQPNGIFIIERILNHKDIDKQIEEWKDLGIVDNKFDKSKVLENRELNKNYQHLPIDTKYFKDLELEILGLFDDLDKSLDGWLIHSENYQALNTILPKFKEKVQTVYIDPPFNKEQNADYLYNVKYKDSTWATMLENRLRLARDLLNEKGGIFVRCDYNGNWIVRPLMDDIFGKENFRNEVILKRTAGLPKREYLNMEVETEYLIYYTKNCEKLLFNQLWEDREPQWMPVMIKYNRGGPTGNPIIIENRVYNPPEGYSWAIGGKIAEKIYREGRLIIKNDKPYVLIDKKTLGTNWTDIPGYVSPNRWGFSTENHEKLLKRSIELTSNENDLVMDFFLGSGTTTAVAHKLKRKWIGVEMGEHFYTIVLPRMKKVLAYDESGISKEKDVREKYNEKNAGGFFKYYDLEQYADTLENTKYEGDGLLSVNNNSYLKYVFLKDLKMLDALTIDEKNGKINVNVSQLYANIDLPETLSNLLGLPIKRIHKDFVEFGDEDNTMINLNDMDWRLIKPLIWW
ncbi:MAG: site-specific DNA-methyltransferase, partial [Candidatus Micrarchaeaceae archaeon]